MTASLYLLNSGLAFLSERMASDDWQRRLGRANLLWTVGAAFQPFQALLFAAVQVAVKRAVVDTEMAAG